MTFREKSIDIAAYLMWLSLWPVGWAVIGCLRLVSSLGLVGVRYDADGTQRWRVASRLLRDRPPEELSGWGSPFVAPFFERTWLPGEPPVPDGPKGPQP